MKTTKAEASQFLDNTRLYKAVKQLQEVQKEMAESGITEHLRLLHYLVTEHFTHELLIALPHHLTQEVVVATKCDGNIFHGYEAYLSQKGDSLCSELKEIIEQILQFKPFFSSFTENIELSLSCEDYHSPGSVYNRFDILEDTTPSTEMLPPLPGHKKESKLLYYTTMDFRVEESHLYDIEHDGTATGCMEIRRCCIRKRKKT